MWRLLTTHADVIYRDLQEYTDVTHNSDTLWVYTLAQCELYVRAEQFPSSWVRRELLNHHISYGAHEFRETQAGFEPPFILSNHVLRLFVREGFKAHDEATQHILHAQMMLIARWQQETAPVLDREQRRAGWSWLVRAAEQWKKRALIEAMDKSPLLCKLVEHKKGDLTATALLTRFHFEMESVQMSHCAASYWPQAERGEVLLYRVLLAQLPVATIGVEHDKKGAWSVFDVRGRFNAEPEAAWIDLAWEIARLLSKLENPVQFRLADADSAHPFVSPARNPIELLVEQYRLLG
jgi:hypothetical protein